MMSVGPICRFLDFTEGKPPLLGGKHAGHSPFQLSPNADFLEEVLEFLLEKPGSEANPSSENMLRQASWKST